MKRFGFVAFALWALAGCVEPAPPVEQPRPDSTAKAQTQYFRSFESGAARLAVVNRRVRPVAVSICKQFSDGMPESFCDFQVVTLNNPKMPANAFQSVNRAGQPVLTFNSNLLREMKNDDEIAFILGHEAGHQIARHLIQKQQNATAGMVLGGIIGGVTGIGVDVGIDLGGTAGALQYSQKFELQADTLGTHIAARAGYNPSLGIAYFERIVETGAPLIRTHPPSQARINLVRAVYADIQAGNTNISW